MPEIEETVHVNQHQLRVDFVDETSGVELGPMSLNKKQDIPERVKRSPARPTRKATKRSDSHWALPLLWTAGALLYFGQGYYFFNFSDKVQSISTILEKNDLIETIQPINVQHENLRIGIFSTYPPQACGIGEFAAEVYKCLVNMRPSPPDVKIIVVDAKLTPLLYSSEVVLIVRKEEMEDYAKAAAYANQNFDVILCEHEFGIFGGQYGDLLFSFAKKLTIPVVYNFHTVLDFHPAPYLRHLTEVLTVASHVTVILPSLCNQLHQLQPRISCSHIPHGIQPIPVNTIVKRKYSDLLRERRLIISAGLMSPGKGIEYMVDAMHHVVKLVPNALYLIIGRQHPGLVIPYAKQLRSKVEDGSLSNHISFISEYQEKSQLMEWMSLADVVVVPHLDLEQVSSGTLTMAMGVGTAAVATRFRYALHMCEEPQGEDSACLLVPPKNSSALGTAVASLLTNATLRGQVKEAAWKKTRSMTWPKVAEETIRICKEALATVPLAYHNVTGGSPGSPWGPSSRQRVLAKGLAQVRSLVNYRAQELLVSDLLPTLEAPTENNAFSHEFAAHVARALSMGGLVFARWLPAPQKLWATVDPDGRFFATNGLLVLHGDLAVGTVFHASPREGLVIGQGVLYSGAFARFQYNGKLNEVRIQENVEAWGHKETDHRVILWFTSRVAASDNTTIGACTYSYIIKGGTQELEVTVLLKVQPEIAIQQVELVLGIDYMSKIHKNLVFDRFFTYTPDAEVDMSDVRESSGDLYRMDKDVPLKWFMLTSVTGGMGLFTLPSNLSLLRRVSHQGSERGKLHYVSSVYETDFLRGSSFMIHERKYLLSDVLMRKLGDYDLIFNNPVDLLGIDLSPPIDHHAVLRAMGMY